MRKIILKAEIKRLQEAFSFFFRRCPVCDAAIKLKGRYETTWCDSACHPRIQERCEKFSKMALDIEEMLHAAKRDLELMR